MDAGLADWVSTSYKRVSVAVLNFEWSRRGEDEADPWLQ
jgi:hypothetical protein